MYRSITWITMSVIAGLFLLIGVQGMVYAQMSNDSSMMGNMTNATIGGNMTNATAEGNMTGNISGLGPCEGC